MTLKEIERIKLALDILGIYYEDGNYYSQNEKGYEVISGHWLQIKETYFETDELSIDDEYYNNF